MRIMAIDYGDAHTGVAISDPTGFLAGFTTVIDAYRPAVVAERLTALAAEHGAEELVLGHPINMDGTRGPREMCIRDSTCCLWNASDIISKGVTKVNPQISFSPKFPQKRKKGPEEKGPGESRGFSPG